MLCTDGGSLIGSIHMMRFGTTSKDHRIEINTLVGDEISECLSE